MPHLYPALPPAPINTHSSHMVWWREHSRNRACPENKVLLLPFEPRGRTFLASWTIRSAALPPPRDQKRWGSHSQPPATDRPFQVPFEKHAFCFIKQKAETPSCLDQSQGSRQSQGHMMHAASSASEFHPGSGPWPFLTYLFFRYVNTFNLDTRHMLKILQPFYLLR